MHPKLDYPWQLPILDILIKLRKNVRCKVSTATRAIRKRLRDPILTVHERIALHNALRELQLLFPRHWNHPEFRREKSAGETAKVCKFPQRQ